MSGCAGRALVRLASAFVVLGLTSVSAALGQARQGGSSDSLHEGPSQAALRASSDQRASQVSWLSSGRSAGSAGASFASGTCPFPPEPEGSPSCNTNPNHVPAPGDGSVGQFSDISWGMDGFKIADNFFTLSPGEIRGLSWTGGFLSLDDQLAALPCDPLSQIDGFENWTIRYYLADGAGGGPGTVVAEFLNVGPGSPGTYTRELLPNEFLTNVVFAPQAFRMTYTFPVADRFNINALELYWIEIFNGTSDRPNNQKCFFLWEPGATSFDDFSLGQTVTSDPFDATDPNQQQGFDMAFCQDFCSSGPLPNAPDIELSLSPSEPFGTGLPGFVDQDECCTFRYTVINRNSPGAGPVTRFFMAVHRGDDDRPACAEDLSEISPPPGYTVSYCSPWAVNSTLKSSFAMYRFDGGSISEGGRLSGHIRIRVNDVKENVLNAENTVPAFGIRVWGSLDPSGDTECGTPNFDPLLDSGLIRRWNRGFDDTCTTAAGNPLRPVPAGTAAGKALLALLLIGGGGWLTLRAKAARVV